MPKCTHVKGTGVHSLRPCVKCAIEEHASREAGDVEAAPLSLMHYALESVPRTLIVPTRASLLIHTLDLSYNRIATLPREFKNLRNLTNLNLSWNALTSLGPVDALPVSLLSLSLDFNNLTTLGAIGQLKALRELTCTDNSVKRLGKEIGKLTDLVSLNLRYNSLDKLPAQLGHCTRITELVLSGNPLEFPPSDVIYSGVEATLKYLRTHRSGGGEIAPSTSHSSSAPVSAPSVSATAEAAEAIGGVLNTLTQLNDEAARANSSLPTGSGPSGSSVMQVNGSAHSEGTASAFAPHQSPQSGALERSTSHSAAAPQLFDATTLLGHAIDSSGSGSMHGGERGIPPTPLSSSARSLAQPRRSMPPSSSSHSSSPSWRERAAMRDMANVSSSSAAPKLRTATRAARARPRGSRRGTTTTTSAAPRPMMPPFAGPQVQTLTERTRVGPIERMGLGISGRMRPVDRLGQGREARSASTGPTLPTGNDGVDVSLMEDSDVSAVRRMISQSRGVLAAESFDAAVTDLERDALNLAMTLSLTTTTTEEGDAPAGQGGVGQWPGPVAQSLVSETTHRTTAVDPRPSSLGGEYPVSADAIPPLSRPAHSHSQAAKKMESDPPAAPDMNRTSTASDVNPPREFLCPIGLTIMHDPVVAADGHTYERQSITHWIRMTLARHNPRNGPPKLTSPMTGAPLEHKNVVPNYALRSMIQEWMEANGVKRDG